MISRFMRHRFIILSIFFILTGLLVYIQLQRSNEPPSDITPEVNVVHNRYVYVTEKALFMQEDNAVVELAQFDQLVEFEFPDVIAVKKNEVWYWRIGSYGEITVSKNLGNLPDLILGMHTQIIHIGDESYIAYVIPLRGLRLINLTTKENTLIMNSVFFRMFTGNQLVVHDKNIYVPNGEVEGGISLWEINTEVMTGKYITVSTQSCGIGAWRVQANSSSMFALSLDKKICLLDIWEDTTVLIDGQWAQQFVNFSIGGKLLATEEFEIINELPVGTGRVQIYDLATGKIIYELDFSDNQLVKNLRMSPGGSFSLVGQVQRFKDEIILFSRGIEKKIMLRIDITNDGTSSLEEVKYNAVFTE